MKRKLKNKLSPAYYFKRPLTDTSVKTKILLVDSKK